MSTKPVSTFLVPLGSKRAALVTITALDDDSMPDDIDTFWKPRVPDAHEVREAAEKIALGEFNRAENLRIVETEGRKA